jgi:peptidoglycan/LPS O-acetylase OafA/YrhL
MKYRTDLDGLRAIAVLAVCDHTFFYVFSEEYNVA